MLKTTILSLSVVLVLGACAAAQTVQPASHVTSTTASRPSAAQQQVIKPGDRNCLRDTGSLIPAKQGQCLQGAFGRSYSAQDLRNTGQPKTADALRMLDPAIH